MGRTSVPRTSQGSLPGISSIHAAFRASPRSRTYSTRVPSTGGLTVKGNQNTTAANVLAAPGRDVPVVNGVLHTIDMVLRP